MSREPGELQLPREGRSRGRGVPRRPAVAPPRCVRAVRAHVSGGGERPEGPGGRALAALGHGIVRGAEGLRVTSLPAGGAGGGRTGRKISTMRPSGARAPVGEGRGGLGARAERVPSPFPELWATRGLGLCGAIFHWVSRIFEQGGNICNVCGLRH